MSSTDDQVQHFLEKFFGKNHEYKVYDGTYGDWMEAGVKPEKYYEVDTLHVEIGSWKWNDTWGMQVIYFKIVRAEATLPLIELHEGEEIREDCNSFFTRRKKTKRCW